MGDDLPSLHINQGANAMQKRQQGLTGIESTIVIAIMGILAAACV
jgi:prepilin-type N-terminal cleavage/methylation domain-containing protein